MDQQRVARQAALCARATPATSTTPADVAGDAAQHLAEAIGRREGLGLEQVDDGLTDPLAAVEEPGPDLVVKTVPTEA
eukprot:7015205-Alexandrium_andersonii.AAC.1